MKLVRPTPGAVGWFIPSTLILLTLEWSWKDTWITPHIGLTSYGGYRHLRIGWLPFAIGIAWPSKDKSNRMSQRKMAELLYRLFGPYTGEKLRENPLDSLPEMLSRHFLLAADVVLTAVEESSQ